MIISKIRYVIFLNTDININDLIPSFVHLSLTGINCTEIVFILWHDLKNNNALRDKRGNI